MTVDELQNLGRSYQRAVLQSDAAASLFAVDEALRRGAQAVDVYSSLLIPAQVNVGILWKNGGLSVAQEHLATQLALRALERVRSALPRRRALGARAIVAGVEGDPHEMGARMFADLLHLDGWDVDFLGADLPAKDLVDFSLQRSPRIVALSLTMREHANSLRRTLKALRAAGSRVPVLAGGAGVMWLKPSDHGPGLTILGDLAQALHAARALARPQDPAEVIAEYLSALGGRIHAMRGERGLSQQELATRAGLDRTYISAVENGKQNVSLATVGRIAHALEVPLSELLVETGP